VALTVIFKYFRVINHAKLDYAQNVEITLAKIIESLNRFRTQNNQLNIPIGILCIVMFAGSQNLLYWLPWLLLEFLLWRWIFIPKLEARFESYIIDLEYSLSKLREVKE
jgi:hypothetical protein